MDPFSKMVKPFECAKCPSFFKLRSHLKTHVKNVHFSETRIYECKVCHKKFDKLTLYLHKKTEHTYQHKVYICKFCAKLYNTKPALSLHVRTDHTKDFNRFQCPYCSSNFKWHHHLKTHISKKHMEIGNTPTDLIKKGLTSIRTKINDCFVCAMNFTKKLDLLLHMRNVHQQELDIYKCCMCDTAFTLADGLKLHFEEHKIEMSDHKCGQCDPVLSLIPYFEDNVPHHEPVETNCLINHSGSNSLLIDNPDMNTVLNETHTKTKNRRLHKKNKTVPDKRDRVAERNKTVPDKRDRVAERKKTVPDKRDRVAERNKTIPDKRDRVAERKKIEPDKRHRVAERNKTVPDKRHRVAERNKTEPNKRDRITKTKYFDRNSAYLNHLKNHDEYSGGSSLDGDITTNIAISASTDVISEPLPSVENDYLKNNNINKELQIILPKFSIKQLMDLGTTVQKINCPYCNFKFKFIESLNRHMKLIHPNLHNCEMSKKNISQKEHEENIATGEKPYMCVESSKIISREENVTNESNEVLGSTEDLYVDLVIPTANLYGLQDKKHKSKHNIVEGHDKNHPIQQHAKKTTTNEVGKKPNTDKYNGKEKFYECGSCVLFFVSKLKLIQHVTEKHMDYLTVNRISCEFCKFTCTDKTNLISHMKEMHPDCNLYECTACNIYFKDENSFNCHVKALHRHVCGVCNLMFVNKEKNLPHIKENHSATHYECEICQSKFRLEIPLIKHKEKEHNALNKEFLCSVCPLSFETAALLKKHENHHKKVHITDALQNAMEICDLCSALLPDKIALSRHTLIEHNKDILHKCGRCASIFNDIKEMREHFLIEH